MASHAMLKYKYGYHYTSWDNWLKIRIEGLNPLLIQHEALEEYFPEGVNGFWIWQNELSDEEHIMCILYQLAFRCQTRIVKLRVKYLEADKLKYKGTQNVVMYYESEDSVIGKWKPRPDNREATILVNHIPASQIEFINEYNIKELFK